MDQSHLYPTRDQGNMELHIVAVRPLLSAFHNIVSDCTTQFLVIFVVKGNSKNGSLYISSQPYYYEFIVIRD